MANNHRVASTIFRAPCGPSSPEASLCEVFINHEFEEAHYGNFLNEVSPGIADGRILYREDVINGLENAPRAFIDMLAARNFGKVLVCLKN
jgi:NADPH-dependent curcumin reductase CurA